MKVVFLSCAVLLATGCIRRQNPDFLGSAVMESRTYQISGMSQGMVMQVYKQEGAPVHEGELLAVIDTVPLALKMAELSAGFAELDQTFSAKKADKAALEAEIRGVAREYGRIGELADKGSVPVQQKDDLGTKVQSSNQKLESAKYMLRSLEEKRRSLDANSAMLKDLLSKCYLKAPAKGIVVSRYKNPGEVVGPGMPVLEIATFDTLYADFYVPQPLLAQVTYGQKVHIRVDTRDKKGGAAEKTFDAAIVWISDEAEFSPKNIQTRESRNELVFKVRAEAANPDGILKRGLPVEVWK
jgi:HlyD family secretion protein